MRTVTFSDTHLGYGGKYDIFAGAKELPALLGTLASSPTRVVFNGDTFDFLLNDDPLELNTARAVFQAGELVGSPTTSEVLTALGKVLAAGGEAIISPGNHDLELAVPQVQAIIREALRQPPEIAARLSFHSGLDPLVFALGKAKLVVAHGDQADVMNRVDHESLHARILQPGLPFRHPPGSVLVKALLNPLKGRFNMRYMDLLKPDFEGAVLTALGVDPMSVRVLLTPEVARLLWRALKNKLFLQSVYAGEDELTLGATLVASLSHVDLSPEESSALADVFAAEPGQMESFSASEMLDKARLKLLRAGLRLYALGQRAYTGGQGVAYFGLEPEAKELKEAQRLARKYGADVVILGHTHSARWYEEGSFVFANTGTWIWLLRLPDPDADLDTWTDFLVELQSNPSLDERRQRFARLERHLTCVIAEELPSGGTSVALSEWDGQQLQLRGSKVFGP